MSVGPIIVSLAGRTLLPKERELLQSPKIGGLVLFKENYNNDAENPKEDLKQLIKEIRQINPNILIMADHEGGKVWRFSKGFTKLPTAKEFGQRYDQDQDKDKKSSLEYAYEQGKLMAQELLDCGVDMSLAPVVDLDGPSKVIGGLLRSFHSDPKIVAIIAERFIKGMHDAGMPCTIKHFPGHGTTNLDSHIDIPVDDRPVEQLQKDLFPFKELISKNLVAAVMPAHVVYTAVDPDTVASFSKAWIQGCLRMGCGFNGVVMSDCLHMKGAEIGQGSQIERFAAAQKTCDFLMYTHQHGEKLDALLSILDKIPDNKISAERRKSLLNSVRHSTSQIVESKDGMDKDSKTDKTVLSQFKAGTTSAQQTGTSDSSNQSSVAANPKNENPKKQEPYSVL